MYTRRDYPALNTLAADYAAQGLTILGFPTAQFANQEPGDGEEILRCLAHVRPGGNFTPAFPLMGKTTVNGKREHALWTWLKGLCPLQASFNYGDISWSPIRPNDIGWNFEKFLVDRSGRPCARYDASVPAADLRADVEAVLLRGCPRKPDGCNFASAASRGR
eukprot:TRINITY_DN3793_c0_g1_i2.p2 TRINITY_DN3793_c0_g1~~TRINITY_DN3793_c0_g1_i2.p2  ORF type:complete len:163 (+),score=17.62 TRINITY_DN3793_c0_g1_i2:266-754(+)